METFHNDYTNKILRTSYMIDIHVRAYDKYIKNYIYFCRSFYLGVSMCMLGTFKKEGLYIWK